MATVTEVLKIFNSWVGKNEKDGTHKEILAIYNAHKPLARGYTVKPTDNWCATTVSAVFIKAGIDFPLECSCEKMIELCKAKGIYTENENRTPKTGEVIFYNWEDSGDYKGTDNKGWADHVGLVKEVKDGFIYVFEGNKANAVGVRKIAVNGKGIRGYATPKYDVSNSNPKHCPYKEPTDTLTLGSKGDNVKWLQWHLVHLGFLPRMHNGKSNIDGSFGKRTLEALNKFHKKYPQCGTNGKADGKAGRGTRTMLKKLALI